MISKEEVEHIAKLARLELTQTEITKMQKDMSAILDYFDLLKKAPRAKTEIKKGDLSATRTDKINSSYGMRDKLIGQAPDKKDDYIKVKTIL
jgi:aspartyl-tRNA(Asn)/glutamyl-tRNA(Gln) amidotransferase subunit C